MRYGRESFIREVPWCCGFSEAVRQLILTSHGEQPKKLWRDLFSSLVVWFRPWVKDWLQQPWVRCCRPEGYSVRLRKLDPYLNVDPGTMSPFEHGEVFVTDDGAETDLDLGHYERFTGVAARKTDSVSSGRIYSNVLEKERRGDYLGKTIQVIPHVTNEIKDFIAIGEDEVDFMLCEIGGTVGDIEGLPFFEAIRQFSQDKPRGQCLFMHLTLLPYIKASGELKTKPTQHSVKELRSIGLAPDILVCRSEGSIPTKEREKLALFCNVRPDSVIAAQDLSAPSMTPRWPTTAKVWTRRFWTRSRSALPPSPTWPNGRTSATASTMPRAK